MTLQQLEYFLAAARAGSFSAAAGSLLLAQPSLSEQIRKLEAELGVSLFTRVGRGVALTEAGRRLLPEAERVLDAAEEAAGAVRGVAQLVSGTASFGTFGNAPYHLLSDLVQDFRTRHPDVRVRVIGLNSTSVADAVREGRLEAGLIALPVDDQGLDVSPVLTDEVFFVSREPDRLTAPMTLERLQDRPLILSDARFGWNDPTRRQLLDRAQRAGVTLEPAMEVEYVEAALELAARGLGDTVTTRTFLGRAFSRRLGSVSFEPPLYETYAFVTRRQARISPAARAFMSIAEKRIKALNR